MQKIMFNDTYGLTQAVLQGRKTMTRRVCKEHSTSQPILTRDVYSFRFYPDENIVEFLMKDGTIKTSVPQYKNNEIVAVAQNYNDALEEYNNMGDKTGWGALVGSVENGCAGYYNKMFVRPELMPHRIQITDVRVEKLQAISDDNCLKEGVIKHMDSRGNFYYYVKGMPGWCFSPRKAFAALIDRPGVGRKGLWESNPFVVVYEFKLVK